MHGVQWRFGLGALMWLIAFAVTPGAAFADAVGTVLFVVGDVKVSTGGAPRRSLGKSDVIVEGDILATGENSSAQIKMRDGGVLAVRANTELKFDIFKIARNPGEPQSSVMSLVKGSLRAITGLIGRNNKQEYKISTAVATIGIRGTDHEAAFIPLALPGIPAGAYSKVNVGQTTLTTTAGTVLVNPNQMGFASSPNAAPQIRPVNANLFTAVPPPATASSGKKDGSGQAATTTAGGGESTQQGGQSSQQGGQTAQNENQNQGQGQPSQSQAQTQGAQAGSQSGNQAAATPTATTTTTPTTIGPVQLTSGTLTLNTTTQTISTSSGTTTSPTYTYDLQARTAADSATAAYNSASALATSTANVATQIAAISTVSTAPASTAISSATNVITTASPVVSSAAALSPADINAAQSYASSAMSAAGSAATAARTAQSVVTANGQFADVTAVRANSVIASASTSAQTANLSAQAAAVDVASQNTALTSAQAAATTALSLANSALNSASAALQTANSNNSTITAAQSAASPLVSQANSAVSAASTAAAAAQAAATLAASLQAAGDLTGAAAQLAIAQQQQTIAQQQLAIAQSAYSSIPSQLTAANSAQLTATSALSSAVTAANNAATSAGTGGTGAQTYASAAQSAALAATSALTTASTQAAAASSSANTAQTNLPIASYFNPKVAGNFSSIALFPSNAAGGGFNAVIVQNSAPIANTQFVLGGSSGLVEIRSTPFQVLTNPAGTALSPSITGSASADVAWSGGSGADSFNLPDNSIYLGRWTGASVTVQDNSNPGSVYSYSPLQTAWGLVLPPAEGYVQSVVGTFNYSLAAPTARTLPVDALGNVGVLNSAYLRADFTNQNVKAGVNLSMNAGPMTGTFDVKTASSLPIRGNTFYSASPSDLTTSCGGTCASGAGGYSARLNGSFAGAAAGAALLSYGVWPTVSSSSSVSDAIFGLAALTTASSPVPPTSPTTSSSYLSNYLVPVPVSGGYTVGETIQSSSLAASAINLYGSGNLYSVLGTSYQQINGSNQIASANVIWNGGSPMDYFQSADQSITFGRWQGGAVTVINTSSPYNQLTFNLNQSGSMIGPTSSLWTYIIAPPSGYVQTLSGTSNYSKVGNTTPFDSVGGAGVLNSATLAANFTNQTVSAGLQLTMNTGPYASDVFNVSATMPINPLQSTNPSGFKVGSTPPAVSCSVGPCIGGAFTGDMRGTFAGSNAASAVLGYGIWATPSSGPPADIINGYVAFSAATPPTSVAAYAGGEIAVQYQSTNVGSAYIAPASNIVVPSTSSTSPQTISFSMPASVTSDYFSNYTSMTSYAATAASVMSLPSGIRYGASPFSSYSFSSTGSYTQPLGGGGLSQWIVGPQAYFDANYQSNGLPIVAQLSYSLAGGTSPVGSGPNGTNVTGTITSATVNANLTAQTVSASVGVTALGNTYLASASNMRFSTFSTLPSGNNYAANPFSGSAVVTNGSTCSTSTCGGYIRGGFTGQNYAGALLSYNLYDSGAGISNLGGVAALSLSPSPSSSAPPTPTGNYLVGNNYDVSLANSVTGPPGVLTGYSDSHSSTTVTCATCAVTSTTSVTQSTGISYGRWDQGTVQSSYSYSNSYSNSGMGGQLYWITGPEPTPYYLPQVLTQQATYTFAGGAAGTGAGPGTVDSGSLTANFSKQTVAVNLAGTANVGTSGSPMNVSWTASTSNALIRANCSANGCFSAGSYYASTSPGYLTTTIDGQSASGNLSGQFTGANLTGAIVSFGLWPATTTIGTNSNIQGVAAFSGAGADPLTPYRLAAVLINDSAYSMGSPEIREGYQPAAAVGFDSGSGMLNQILVPPNSASGNSSTNSITTSSLSFSGGTVSPSSGFLGANSGAGTACNPCTDPVTGISWGRWSSVTVTKNDLINNIAGLPTQVAGGGVHWISTPSLIGPVTLPISGTYSYVVAGGTNPTDSTGAQGVLNSAALTANFTQQTVNLGVNLSMPNAAITASASNVPIYKGAEFSTGSYSKSPLSVTCTGTACGASPQGKVGGVFVGSGGQGAVMGYGFMPNPAASNTITGVVSFRR
jgi:hypothetical protein